MPSGIHGFEPICIDATRTAMGTIAIGAVTIAASHVRQLHPGNDGEQDREQNRERGDLGQRGTVRMLAHPVTGATAMAEHLHEQAAQFLRRLFVNGEARIAVGTNFGLAYRAH